MLIQATTPRPTFDVSRHPAHYYIHTIQKAGVSDGAVLFRATASPTETATKSERQLTPARSFDLPGSNGCILHLFVAPFFELFREEDRKRNMWLSQYCTNGFDLVIRSAFRADPRAYEEHTIRGTIMTPLTGGGVLRLADCPFDIVNGTFDPWAADPYASAAKQLPTPDPKLLGPGPAKTADGLTGAASIMEEEDRRVFSILDSIARTGFKSDPNLTQEERDLVSAYSRVHRASNSRADDLRRQRIAEAEEAMARNAEGTVDRSKRLPGGR